MILLCRGKISLRSVNAILNPRRAPQRMQFYRDEMKRARDGEAKAVSKIASATVSLDTGEGLAVSARRQSDAIRVRHGWHHSASVPALQ
jgi:hypothetical protein